MNESLLIMQMYLIFVIAGTWLISRSNPLAIRIFSLVGAFNYFLMCIILYNYLNHKKSGFQYECSVPVIPEYNLTLTLGVDGISIALLILTSFVTVICLFAASNITKNYKQFIMYLLFIELFLSSAFLTTNVFFFYVFFEAVLIPMFLLIGVWGGRERKIKAAYYFFLYTLIGSFFFLYGILYLYTLIGSFNYSIITFTDLSKENQIFLFWFFFIPFAMKIPMIPFHLWLPEAHVEAPTIGSVILASLLLKLGAYGFLRFTIPWFPAGCIYYIYVVYALAIIGIIYASFAAIRQSDLKRIIAYSSVAHMNIVVLGLFSFSHEAMDGAFYLMISHGIVSSALFICVGVLYDRHHTRLLRYYSGLVQIMPLFCAFFFIFTCANMSFPGTANFVGELLVFSGFFIANDYLVFFAAGSIVLSAIYSIWVYNRVAYGTLKTATDHVSNYADLNREEIYILVFLTIAMVTLGINSSVLTSLTNVPINTILEVVNWKS